MKRSCCRQAHRVILGFPVMTSVIKYVFTVVGVVDQTFNPGPLAAAFLHPSLPVLHLPLENKNIMCSFMFLIQI